MKHQENSSLRPQGRSHGFARVSPVASGRGPTSRFPFPVSRLMLRFAHFGWLAALLVGFQSAFGFALLGPINEPWQTSLIGYNLSGADIPNFGNGSADLGAPKQIGQGYRRNTAVMYYTCDNNFQKYFGSNGIVAIDGAYQILNQLPPVSQMSADLSEYPQQARRFNGTAEALYLADIKSVTLSIMMEQLGLAEPERYIWAMHDRYLPSAGTCPQDEEYLIVRRNFDAVTTNPSSYVNGTLYSYVIDEQCAKAAPPAWRAMCHPYPVDLDAATFTALASGVFGYGSVFTGLTRDDVGGIRYLLSSNNVAIESPPTNNTITITTNLTQAREVFTSNLTQFAQQALATNAAGLAALYPGLAITATTNIPVYQWVTNITFLYLANAPFDPVGTPPHIAVYATNRVKTVQMQYQHTFGNLITFNNTSRGWMTVPITTLAPYLGHGIVTLQTSTASPSPWDPTGLTLVTNTSSRTFLTNEVVGDFAILPTNSCGFQVAFPLLTNVYTVTNLLSGTNSVFGTNTIVSTGTNSPSGSTNQPSVSQSLIEYLTNRVFWAYDVTCQTNVAARHQGIEKITYVRKDDYDMVAGRYYHPITNQYSYPMIDWDNAFVPQTIQRIVIWPDFLFTTSDNVAGPGVIPTINDWGRNVQFDQSPGSGGQAGPGTIEPGTTFTFNSAAPVFYNIGGVTGNENTGGSALIWASFDMSTNAPIIYPSGTSVADVENMMLIQVLPLSLPGGRLGSYYSAQFQLQVATQQWGPGYSWDLAPNSKGNTPGLGLPPGLSLSQNGQITGVPTSTGVFNFVVRVTDSAGRFVDHSYYIQVD